ncbi:hypothetical protein J4453_01590 [Candidatus Woesearchaeota archaeon]|nr:hypothetical protein [Candidatus Woesearchaeota archaeon]
MALVIWEIIGWIAVALTASQFYPQLIRAFRTKKVRDISLLSFVMVTISATCWLIYGYYKADMAIITANVLVLIAAIIILVLKIRYRKR